MTDTLPPGTERDREVARVLIRVEDPFGDFHDRMQQARVRAVAETVSLAIFEDAINRLIERAPGTVVAATLERLKAGEAVSMRPFFFSAIQVRLDRATATLVGKYNLPLVGPVEIAFPLAADLGLSEGSIKLVAAVTFGILVGAIIEPAIQDSVPGTAAREAVQEAIDAGWAAAAEAVSTTQRALAELDIDGDIHQEGDHIVIVLRRPEEDENDPCKPKWK